MGLENKITNDFEGCDTNTLHQSKVLTKHIFNPKVLSQGQGFKLVHVRGLGLSISEPGLLKFHKRRFLTFNILHHIYNMDL